MFSLFIPIVIPPIVPGPIIAPVTQNTGTQTVDILGQGAISPINTVGQLVQTGASAILTIGGFALLMYLLMGGFKWVTAGGEKGKVESAREMITQGIIGFAILASVFAIYGLVLRYFNVKSIDVGQSALGSSSASPVPGTCSDYCAGTTQTGAAYHPDQCENQGGHRVAKMCHYTACGGTTYPCLIP